ncbi:arginine kinase-like [Mytilus edulis]|uniref:arginine kinase-like n=1 Tax=Mytilus edulis TaxID=6550 RepID=UPI0039EEA9F0
MYKNYCNQLEQQKQPQQEKMSDLAELWKKLSGAKYPDECKSLLKQCLTQELFDQLKDKKTSLNGTLADCIRSGAKNLDSGVGLYACDPEAYTTFKPLFDAVIKMYHKVDTINHPKPDFGDISKLDFGDIDPSGEMIVSTRVRVGRSHDGYSFPPCSNKEARIDMLKKTEEACATLPGELAGKMYRLEGMSKTDEQQLIDDHFLFKNDDRMLGDAGGYADWPIGRGIFHNPKKTFLVWVNEEDHLRFISMQMGGNLGEVYKRLVSGIQELEKKLTFAKKDGYGYLTFCPTNLGTTCRASVHIKIPKLSKLPEFKEFCEKLNLQPRGIHGEHTESVGGVFDISNKRRLGLTEYEAIQEMRKGVEEIIKKEKSL